MRDLDPHDRVLFDHTDPIGDRIMAVKRPGMITVSVAVECPHGDDAHPHAFGIMLWPDQQLALAAALTVEAVAGE